ncbi:glycoside hydrolase family 15 [Georgenia sp. EYE_87]|uniref:glycoside hydrolase family 15 protein n=1 Tax=Georgenia sp. EYE_87 TaxID=2853448 RepID=UPI0020050202|nr:glycoside hydrolase family 15 protein [Georgenia sp. EYE_87]MCK6212476.1 glycoside hydrolase family 15 [Georgenia sp. EYE_87]
MTTAVLPERAAARTADGAPPPARRRRGRRVLAWSLAAALWAGTAAWSVHLKAHESTEEFVALYLDGVHLQPDGTVADVPAHEPAEYLPGSRVLAEHAGDVEAEALAAAQRAWLAEGTVPGAGTPYEEVVTDALLDIRTLTGAAFDDGGAGLEAAPGAVVAGWSDRWRYVWPRDASFVAAALARTGHVEDAVAVLGFVADVQSEHGGFQARYVPDGSGVPDARGIQLDGNGWVLWSAATVLAQIEDDGERAAAFARLRPLVDTTVDHVLELTAEEPHLPPPSADYWEVRETDLTLGTVAPMLAGLEHAARLYADQGLGDRAAEVGGRAAQVRSAVVTTFGPGGYERYADGGPVTSLLGADGRDAATAMLLPPFTAEAPPGAVEAWLLSAEEMARPAGGVAPGAGWKRDGITWTPETTLYALAAAENGHPRRATAWLDWVMEHRTASGAIPEKVLANGAPAAVAPLTWSGANVILAVAALEESGAL